MYLNLIDPSTITPSVMWHAIHALDRPVTVQTRTTANKGTDPLRIHNLIQPLGV